MNGARKLFLIGYFFERKVTVISHLFLRSRKASNPVHVISGLLVRRHFGFPPSHYIVEMIRGIF